MATRARIVPPVLETVPPPVRVKVAPTEMGTGVVSDSGKSSYSDHDTQKCGAAGTHRDDIDDGSLDMEFCLHPHQCPSGLGSCRHAVVVVYLCIRFLDCGCVLLHFPQGTVGVILARTALASRLHRDAVEVIRAGVYSC
jgi:hypothetical protein